MLSSGRYEKFSKALISQGNPDENFTKSVGHRLEIIPVDNPQSVKAGSELKLKVLFDGKPLATELYATYDGFSSRSNTYAYFSNSNKEGQGAVKITEPGVWMVRVQHEIDKPTEDFDKEVIRAVLLFGIEV